ncbi:MAG: COX15/CtaA family protein [Candidatus Omnitrophica bacterium]|nr:COX15/CtaA family protein [Candidatus Omnitrophota bacterium]
MLWLHRFTKLVVLSTFILIVAGGLVTSTGSGLSVPDWPLSYGKFFPPMIGGIRFEHTHRVIAGIVGILTLVLTIWLLKAEKRASVRWLGVSALLMVIAQGVLGGITVIRFLPDVISILHACIAQTFFCLIAALALVTSPSWNETSKVQPVFAKPLHPLLILTTVFIYLQLIAGATIRHTAGQHGLIWHFIGAFLIFVHALLVVIKIPKQYPDVKKLVLPAISLGMLVIVQIFLGFGAFIFKIMLEKAAVPRPAEVFFATAHQAAGALILVTSVLLTLRYFKQSQTANHGPR